MSTPNITRWIGIGLLGLPLYGVLTFFSTLDPQPDPNTHYEAWSRFVTTNGYTLKHLFLTVLGTIFGIFGSIALGAYLTKSRAGRMGLWAMVISVLGYCLFLTWGGVSTFAAPQEGQAYLAGIEEYHKLPSILANTLQSTTVLVSIVLGFVGNVLLGVAVWRSGVLPRWAGVLWAVAPVFMYPLGPRVCGDDRAREHPADGAGGRGAASDKRGVDGLERDARTYKTARGPSAAQGTVTLTKRASEKPLEAATGFLRTPS